MSEVEAFHLWKENQGLRVALARLEELEKWSIIWQRRESDRIMKKMPMRKPPTTRLPFMQWSKALGVLLCCMALFLICRGSYSLHSYAATVIRGRGDRPNQAVTTSVYRAVPKVIWDIGDEPDAAVTAPIYRDGAAGMISMWVNNQGDITGWAKGVDLTPIWAKGKAVELIVWLADNPEYAIDPQFQTDITGLVHSLTSQPGAKGPLFVTLFTEYETYSDDAGGPGSYWEKLKASYKQAVPSLRAISPEVKVGFSFGGYDWPDDPTGINPDVSNYEDVIAASDYIACQQMQDSLSIDSAGQNILINKTLAAVRQLGTYGKPVMVAHYKNWGSASDQTSAFYKIADALFNDRVMSIMVKRDHLFAFNFMNDHYISDPGTTYDHMLPLLLRYKARSNRFPVSSMSLFS